MTESCGERSPRRSGAVLSWLHLSDFHLRRDTGWSQDVVLTSMLADVGSRYAKEGRPDLLFLTGDIAFSGQADEYALAEDFIRRLCSALGVPLARVCVVPGNHDVDRSREEDAISGARSKLDAPLEVDRFFQNEGRRKTVFARLAAFREFANRLTAPSWTPYTEASYAHARTIEVGALRVRILHLDSAWLADGGAADVGNLLVGERQVFDCAAPDAGCVTFALLHHPFAWLRDFEQVAIEDLVARAAQICLRGHVHTADHRTIDGPSGRLTTFTAGAAFQSRTADNTYMWCALDLTTGLGRKIVHRYRHAAHVWEAGEEETWRLGPAVTPKPDAGVVLEALAGTGIRYPSYATCLVAGLRTDTPMSLPDGRVTTIASDAEIPGTTNTCGSIVRQLQNHFHWKPVWEPSGWDEQFRELVGGLDTAFGELERLAQPLLQHCEDASSELLQVLGPRQAISSVCAELLSLLTAGELERARAVAERWKGAGVLRPHEEQEFTRLHIMLLLAERHAVEALEIARELMALHGRTAATTALAARCAYDAGEFHEAAVLAHQALDFGMPLDELGGLALRIAGASGDARLTERVRT